MITITEEAKQHLIKVLDTQSKPIVLFGLKGGGCAGFEYSWDTYNEDGYTEKTEKEIKHDELISDFINFQKIVEKYL